MWIIYDIFLNTMWTKIDVYKIPTKIRIVFHHETEFVVHVFVVVLYLLIGFYINSNL